MNTQEVIDRHKRTMQKDTHPENEGARDEREVLAKLELLRQFETREHVVKELLQHVFNYRTLPDAGIQGAAAKVANFPWRTSARHMQPLATTSVASPDADGRPEMFVDGPEASAHIAERHPNIPVDPHLRCFWELGYDSAIQHVSTAYKFAAQPAEQKLAGGFVAAVNEQRIANLVTEIERLRGVEAVLRANAVQQGAYVAGVCEERQSANDEAVRLRALFGAFQLECCEDWTCAQDHARKAGEVIGELREEVRRLRAGLEKRR